MALVLLALVALLGAFGTFAAGDDLEAGDTSLSELSDALFHVCIYFVVFVLVTIKRILYAAYAVMWEL